MGLFDKETTTTSQLEGWDDAQAGLTSAMAHGEAAMANPWEVYGGPQVAGLNQMQQGALGGMAGYGAGMGGDIASMMMGAGGQAMGHMGQAGNLYNQAANMGPAQIQGPDLGLAGQIANNPYTQGVVDNAMRASMQGFNENVSPALAGQAAGANQLNSSRRGGAEAIAMRGQQDRMANIASDIYNGNWQQGLGIAQQQAMGNAQYQSMQPGQMMQAANGLSGLGGQGSQMMQGAYGMGQNNLNMGLQAGNIYQGQQQSEYDSMMNNFYLGQQLPMQQAQAGVALFDPLSQAYGLNTNTQTSSMNPLGGLLQIGGQLAGAAMAGGMNPFSGLSGMFGGGAAGAAGAAGGMGGMGGLVSGTGNSGFNTASSNGFNTAFGGSLPSWPSDARLKEDIEYVRDLPNGVAWYRWKWNAKAKALGIDTPASGVIAQELAVTHPHLVTIGENGFLQVDYSGLEVPEEVAA